MESKYILGIDQSTQGTKVLLFDEKGKIVDKVSMEHRQIIDQQGWVEHDPIEIYNNTIFLVKRLIEKLSFDPSCILGVGLTNQRETALVWDKETGKPVYNAIVWQCARAAEICKRIEDHASYIQESTGLHLSPYFTAGKIAWVLENVEGAKEKSEAGKLAYGTVDSWLIYKLTKNKTFKTDYSNASRTQLFNINTLTWDEKICGYFGINTSCLAKVVDSNSNFGMTDFDGVLEQAIPIHSVMGDSHGALFGQNCQQKGMVKATYGTGSSIMMNIGKEPIYSDKGIVTSLAWGVDGEVSYVLEGNINYTGAVISWLKNDLKLIENASETDQLAMEGNKADHTYLVPAFSGLGAPYWDSDATAILCGMTRTTGKAEIVKAALESIGYQIGDIVNLMSEESGITIEELRVDGGPTRNQYLMQFQSDLLDTVVAVPQMEELSVIGVSYMAGIAMGIYDLEEVMKNLEHKKYFSAMDEEERSRKYQGWKKSVAMVLA